MSESINLASRYKKQVDERFSRDSLAALAVSDDYSFTGVKTVNVYSIPTVPLGDYSRSGLSRYGAPGDLGRNVQSLTVTQDKAFTFIIDKGDKLQSEMVMDAGKALSRQIREVCVPEFDLYVFRKLAATATDRGNFATTAITASNAYAKFLAAQESLGNHNVPDSGRMCFCSYAFANLIRQDPAFMMKSNLTQEMVNKGILGEIDGVKIVRVPSTRLPAGCAFILTHPGACVAPRQLEEYKTHLDPPGISGYLVEGRIIYDAFILNGRADGIFYHGSQAVLKGLDVITTPVPGGKTSVVVNTGLEGASRFYITAASRADLPAIAVNTVISEPAYTPLTANGLEIEVPEGHRIIRVAEVNASSKPIACGETVIYGV